MNVLIACDSFKDALSATEVCNAIAEGILYNFPESQIIQKPLADGGEGTLEALKVALNGTYQFVQTFDALHRPIEASYLWIAQQKIAIVEMAKASGLELLKPEERNVMTTSTFGTGVLIRHALDKGAPKIFLTVGGSATNDAGMGMAKALGYKFLDDKGNYLEASGENLKKIASINAKNIDKRIHLTEFYVATDVTNTLFGKNGAAYIYAPQKGANQEEVVELNHGLEHIHQLFKDTFSIDTQEIAGSGAGGGIGAGGICFLGGKVISAANWVFEAIGLSSAIEQTDIVITGEGRIDSQSFQGKVLSEVLKYAKTYHKPIFGVAGQIQELDKLLEIPEMVYVSAIQTGPQSLADSLKNSRELLIQKGKVIGKMLKTIYHG
jgi:glycerate kinase